MEHTNSHKKGSIALFIYYFFMYVAMAPFTAFLSTYYNEIGLSAAQIGTLSGIGPIIVIIGQFIWGRLADRAKYKNTVLLIATIATGLSIYAFSLSPSFTYLLIINIIYNFSYCSVVQLSDSIALEYATSHQLRFSIIRLGGSLGFAVCTFVVGFLLTGDAGKMFVINALFVTASFLSLLFIPRIQGAKQERRKGKYRDLFKDRNLVILLIFNFVIYTGYFFNMTFYSVLMAQHGATSVHIGIALTISAIFEIPFLLYSQRIINKIGLRSTLLLACVAFMVRWILCGTLKSAWPLAFVCVLHGFGHIVVSYCTSSYINKTVSYDMRASGQTLLGMTNYGFSKCFICFVGGALSDMFGVGTVFLFCSGLSLVAFLILMLFLPKLKIRI